MPVSESLIEEAVRHLEGGRPDRARTILEEALKNRGDGHWSFRWPNGDLAIPKVWRKLHHALASLRSGRANRFLWSSSNEWPGRGWAWNPSELEWQEGFLMSPNGKSIPVKSLVSGKDRYGSLTLFTPSDLKERGIV